MFGHKKEYYFFLIFGVISWWLVDYFAVEVFVNEEVPPHSPDFYSVGYQKLEMNESGEIDTLLIAEEMQHYQDDETTEVLKPVMTFYNEKTPPWQVQSETGLLSADGKDLMLYGAVKISRDGAEGVRAITVNTTNLKVKPGEGYAETDEWAELITPPNWVSGIGMKVYFQKPVHLEFLSQVRSRHELN